MSAARRDALHTLPFWPQRQPHAGLWFDKYLKSQKGSTLEPYFDHIQQTGDIRDPAVYEQFFTRWQETLTRSGAVLREADAVARLAAGLGGESVIENGLTFHHTYGVPIIPGSSLKGTTRAYAAANLAGPWAEKGDAFRTLFGGQVIGAGEADAEKARVGIAVFLDALPLPGTFTIHNEVMTVHHTDYYQGKNEPPADWDSPTPIPFPSVHGRFLLAISAPQAQEWAATAMGILKMALADIGVGGKTSSGFGRFRFAPEPGYERGTVKEFGAQGRSFGFVTPDTGEDDMFFHRDDLRPGQDSVKAGDIVDFRRVLGDKGYRASDVHLA